MNDSSPLICMQRLKGLSALVTGANSGIGEAIARALALEGAKVVINYVSNAGDAEEIVKEIREKKGQRLPLRPM